jgi:hypothetical protein
MIPLAVCRLIMLFGTGKLILLIGLYHIGCLPRRTWVHWCALSTACTASVYEAGIYAASETPRSVTSETS